jgi:hypothetical protein
MAALPVRERVKPLAHSHRVLIEARHGYHAAPTGTIITPEGLTQTSDVVY